VVTGHLSYLRLASNLPGTFFAKKTFHDARFTKSLPSPNVKKIGKTVNICQSYGQLSRGSFL